MLEKYDAVKTFLGSAFIPMDHRFHCFLQKANSFLRKMAFPLPATTGMPELKLNADGSKLWKDVEQQVDSALLIAIMMDGKAELSHGSYTVLHRICCKPDVLA